MSRALREADGAECVVSARVSRGLGVTGPSKPSKILRSGRAAPYTLAHAGRGKLRRAGKFVGLSVFGGSHAMRQVHVRGKAEAGFPALVADESPLRVLGETPVHTSADWLTYAGCGLVGVLAARLLVMLETDPV